MSVHYSTQQVESFLRQFKVKVDIFGVIFLHREKQLETMRILGLPADARKPFLKELVVDDYIETILKEEANNNMEMWVFGKTYDNKDIYIKISMGEPNSKTICVSFHIAERPLKYHFK